MEIQAIMRKNLSVKDLLPDSKLHGTNMGPIWRRQTPSGPHIGPIRAVIYYWTNVSVYWTISTLMAYMLLNSSPAKGFLY